MSPGILLDPPRLRKISGFLLFSVLVTTSRPTSLPPFGVAHQEFCQTISNLALNATSIKNVKSSHQEHFTALTLFQASSR
ncbi:hypothetical protein FR965_25435 [Serratia marcescens]|nr:hypothetical protein FR965_25435 [Serratia marcescens]